MRLSELTKQVQYFCQIFTTPTKVIAQLVRMLVYLFLLAGALRATHPLSAQTTPPEVSVKLMVGWDGKAKSNLPAPLFVEISNSGNATPQVVQLVNANLSNNAVQVINEWHIDLANGAKKQFHWSFTPYNGIVPSALRILDAVERIVYEQNINLRLVEFPEKLNVLLCDTPEYFTRNPHFANQLAPITLERLPLDSGGWLAVDELVISNTDTGKLSAEQQTAIQGWVAAGNRLTVFGGAHLDSTKAGLGSLLPIENLGLTDPSDVVAQELVKRLNNTATLAAVPYSRFRTNESHINRMYGGEDVLIAEFYYGDGSVIFSALDPTLAPLAEYDRLDDFTKFVTELSGTVSKGNWATPNRDWSFANQIINVGSGAQLPRAWQLCLFMGIYVMLVGPINFLLLAVLKRRNWAWVSVPFLSIIFVVYSYLFGYGYAGNSTRAIQYNVVESYENLPVANVHSLTGVYSARRTRHTLEIAEKGNLASVQSITDGYRTQTNLALISSGGAVSASNIFTDVGEAYGFYYSGNTAPFEIHSQLEELVESGKAVVRGTIQNTSGRNLQDVRLLIYNKIYLLEDLPANAQISFDSTQLTGIDSYQNSTNYKSTYLDNYNTPTSGISALLPNPTSRQITTEFLRDNPQAYLRYMLINWLLPSNAVDLTSKNIYLIGWENAPTLQTSLNGRLSTTTAGNMHIIRLNTQKEKLSGLLQFSENEMQASIFDTGTSYANTPQDIYLFDAYISLSFQPPILVLPKEVSKLKISINGDASLTSPVADTLQVLLWNFDKGEWETIKNLEWGKSLTINNPDKYVSDIGEVRVLLDNSTLNNGDSTYIANVKVALDIQQ